MFFDLYENTKSRRGAQRRQAANSEQKVATITHQCLGEVVRDHFLNFLSIMEHGGQPEWICLRTPSISPAV